MIESQSSSRIENLMTALPDRPNTALLVIDMQNGVVEGIYERTNVVANIKSLVGKARAEEVPVIWVQHSDDQLVPDSPAWQYVPELERLGSEPLVHKTYRDSFENTELEEILADHAVGRLFISGAHTDACVRSTLHGALVRGYDTILVADAHTAEDLTDFGAPPPDQVITHTNLYWSSQTAPGRKAGTVVTDEVVFAD